MSNSAALPQAADDGAASGEPSPFETARITQGYPFDKAEQRVIERVLEDVRERQQDVASAAAGTQSDHTVKHG